MLASILNYCAPPLLIDNITEKMAWPTDAPVASYQWWCQKAFILAMYLYLFFFIPSAHRHNHQETAVVLCPQWNSFLRGKATNYQHLLFQVIKWELPSQHEAFPGGLLECPSHHHHLETLGNRKLLQIKTRLEHINTRVGPEILWSPYGKKLGYEIREEDWSSG